MGLADLAVLAEAAKALTAKSEVAATEAPAESAVTEPLAVVGLVLRADGLVKDAPLVAGASKDGYKADLLSGNEKLLAETLVLLTAAADQGGLPIGRAVPLGSPLGHSVTAAAHGPDLDAMYEQFRTVKEAAAVEKAGGDLDKLKAIKVDSVGEAQFVKAALATAREGSHAQPTMTRDTSGKITIRPSITVA